MGEEVSREPSRVPSHAVVVRVVRLSRSVLHAVTGIELPHSPVTGDALIGHRCVSFDFLWCTTDGQTQIQLTILIEQEFSTAVGSTHHEIVETLVILYEIGLNHLRRYIECRTIRSHGLLVIPQELAEVVVFLQHMVTHFVFQGFLGQNTRSQLLGHEGLGALLECHQLIHTVDQQAYK